MTEINNIKSNKNYNVDFEGMKMPSSDTLAKYLDKMILSLRTNINPNVKNVYPRGGAYIERVNIGSKNYSLHLEKFSPDIDPAQEKRFLFVTFSDAKNGVRSIKRPVETFENEVEADRFLSDSKFQKKLLNEFKKAERAASELRNG